LVTSKPIVLKLPIVVSIQRILRYKGDSTHSSQESTISQMNFL